jgi:hypothetical protein
LKPLNISEYLLFSFPALDESLRFNPYQTLTACRPGAGTGAALGPFAAPANRHQEPDPKCSKARLAFRSLRHPAISKTRSHYKHFTKDVEFISTHFPKGAQKSSTNDHCAAIEAPGFTRQDPGIFLKNSKKSQKRPYSHGDYITGDSVDVATTVQPAYWPVLQLAEIVELSLTRSPGRYRL